ncbi:MAG: alpha/beta hydrolase, partial [Patescibacteria group bacterium]
LHGMPSKERYDGNEAGKHWIPWLKGELESQGYVVYTPELPEPYAPDYAAWKGAFEQFIIDNDTALIGHSCGGGFLVRYLSENDIQVGKVVLVAPYLDPDDDHIPEFFDFILKRNLVAFTAGVTVFVSTDDDSDILESVKQIQTECDDIKVQEFTDKGHFIFSDMNTREFPELLETILE